MSDTAHKRRPNILNLIAITSAVLAILLFFSWIYKVMHPVKQENIPKESLLTNQPQNPPNDPTSPITGKADPNMLPLGDTEYTVIVKPRMRVVREFTSGDSLVFVINEKDVRIRIQGVEAFETANGTDPRREKQAQHFGRKVDEINKLGNDAFDFTHGLLSTHDYKVITKWKEADSGAFWGNVYVNWDGNRWAFLSELLLARGFALFTGNEMDPPLNCAKPTDFADRHRECESHAKTEKLGGWAVSK